MNEAINDQARFKSELGEIERVQKKHLLKESKIVKYSARNAAIDFFNEYVSRASEAKHQANKGTGLKILTPKQMLQGLPIGLAQIKEGNNSESLVNEIRKIVYSLYQSKEITKKVYNNIIKSIKV